MPASQSDEPTPAFGGALRAARLHRRLSQMDLALEAEVSQRHLSCLESGRARPSRSMILRLAEALDLDLSTRNRLLHAAGLAREYPVRRLNETAMAPVKQALEMMLAQNEPFPALVVDRCWNMIMGNKALERMLGALGGAEALWTETCGSGPRNVLRLTFHPQGLRQWLINANEIAPLLLSRALRESENEEELRAIIDDILNTADLPRGWRHPPTDAALLPVLPFELILNRTTLRMFTMISSFGTPLDVTADSLRVEKFFPIDEATREVFERLAASA